MDDQYYQQLSSSRSEPCIATEAAAAAAPDSTSRGGRAPGRKQSLGQRSVGGQVTEGAASEPESHRTEGDNRQVQQHVTSQPRLLRSLPVPSGRGSGGFTSVPSSRPDRRCLPRTLSADSQAKENPYDFRHLLRKTSQRRKLIKRY